MSSKPTPEFIKWWRNHRDAGYCQDRFHKDHWGIYPSAAWRSDAYRTEFVIFSGEDDYHSKLDYTQEDINKWALAQKQADEFAEKHGFGYGCEENKRIWDRLGGVRFTG